MEKKFVVSHIISSIDNASGGPSRSVTHLLKNLVKVNPFIELGLHTCHSPDPIINSLESESIALKFYKSNVIGALKGFKKNLEKQRIDLFHGHGLWQMPVHQMANYAQHNNIPYLISPRGMLEPWSLQQGKLKKKVALKLFQYKDLKKAACIHATAEMEAQNIRELGFKNPIAVIPNGIPIEDFPLMRSKKQVNERSILFLSRIHPKKGIELLIEAWGQLPSKLTKEWQINIVGNGENNYIKQLNSSISSKGLSDTIQIKKPLYGNEKTKAYQDASLFVLPTYSENFGIVIAEALACGTPVITTKAAPWKDLETYNCGWWIETGVKPLKKTLENALMLPLDKLHTMGLNGRKLVEEKYSIKVVSKSMSELYKYILEGTTKPDFVQTS